MSFAERPPSVQWEPVAANDGSPLAWVWWKPAAAPHEIIVSLAGVAMRPTVGGLIGQLGLTPAEIAGWLVAGQYFDAAGGQNPLLHARLPETPDLEVRLVAAANGAFPTASPPMMGGPAAAAVAPTRPRGGACEVDQQTAERLLGGIDADWNSTLKLERDLAAKQKEVQSLLGRINTLNRDLNADERAAADSNDLRSWQDARRWLRDATAKLSKVSRDFDLGSISAAGSRNQYESIHREYVAQRKPFAGILQVAKEFEQHRKTAQNLLQAMSAAHAAASRDAEGRARQVLAKIAANARKKRRR